jgi:hypothetical protein
MTNGSRISHQRFVASVRHVALGSHALSFPGVLSHHGFRVCHPVPKHQFNVAEFRAFARPATG